MSKQPTFSPAEVSELFDISKSTLLRWEREGVVPPAQRDISSRQSERAYTTVQIKAISRQTLAMLQQQMRAATKGSERDHEDEALRENLRALLETRALHKFLAGDPVGLAELREHERLTTKTIVRLLRVAASRSPDDPLFADILEVLAKQSHKLLAAAHP